MKTCTAGISRRQPQRRYSGCEQSWYDFHLCAEFAVLVPGVSGHGLGEQRVCRRPRRLRNLEDHTTGRYNSDRGEVNNCGYNGAPTR